MKAIARRMQSVYRRYAIVSERDITEGLAKVAAFRPVAVAMGPVAATRTQNRLLPGGACRQIVEWIGGLGRN